MGSQPQQLDVDAQGIGETVEFGIGERGDGVGEGVGDMGKDIYRGGEEVFRAGVRVLVAEDTELDGGGGRSCSAQRMSVAYEL